MSHFTVLVIGEDYERALAPFHEFECTGDDDEFVQDIDKTEESRKAFESHEPKGEYPTFAEYLARYCGRKVVLFGESPDLENVHKYGYTLVDEKGEVVKTVDRTNPNRKWDWYQVGGRWNGFFKLKETAKAAVLGTPSLVAVNFDPDYEKPKSDRADSCRKGDIDIEGMRDEAGEKAGKYYDGFRAIVGAYPPIVSWKQVLSNYDGNVSEARIYYREQLGVKALNGAEGRDYTFADPDDFDCSREEYVRRARSRAISTFAFIKDGKWVEKGNMGWWGMVQDEKDPEAWEREFSKMLDELPDDVVLTVVDCHI